MTKHMTSAKIVALLEDRHSADIFVSECKTGATQRGLGMAVDAWAMKRTWCPPTTFAYEVKVSRSDFLSDNKWPMYLNSCHQFYFVCLFGLIAPEETPEGCGLMWATKTGTRIYTKRKAPRRDIEWPGEVMAYILMTRSTITASNFERLHEQSNESYWRQWLSEKKERKQLGYRVRGKIAKIAAEVECENERLEARVENCHEIEERIKELGFDPTVGVSLWKIRDKLNQIAGEIPECIARDLKTNARLLERIADRIEEVRKNG